MSKRLLISARYTNNGPNMISDNDLNAQAHRLSVAYTT